MIQQGYYCFPRIAASNRNQSAIISAQVNEVKNNLLWLHQDLSIALVAYVEKTSMHCRNATRPIWFVEDNWYSMAGRTLIYRRTIEWLVLPKGSRSSRHARRTVECQQILDLHQSGRHAWSNFVKSAKFFTSASSSSVTVSNRVQSS